MNHETPKLAVDCIVVVPGGIVLIERTWAPLGFALPGGFVDVGETLEQAAIREMNEELNLNVKIQERLGIYDEPNRDPRKHVVSVCFVGTAKKQPAAGDDAKAVHVVRVEHSTDLEKLKLVFDHEAILKDFKASRFFRLHPNAQETTEEWKARRRKENAEYKRLKDNSEICAQRVGCICPKCISGGLDGYLG